MSVRVLGVTGIGRRTAGHTAPIRYNRQFHTHRKTLQMLVRDQTVHVCANGTGQPRPERNS